MKKYLIVAAMQEELDALFRHVKPQELGNNIYLIQEEGYEAYVILSGIGKVAMAYRLGSFINDFQVDEIINLGVAGTLSSELKAFDTLIASRCAYSDADLTAFGYPFGQMSGCPLYFECDGVEVRRALSYPDKNIKTGLILSSDSFITKKNLNSNFFEYFENPVSCDMESAAVGQCAYIAKIPFVIIRTISDDTTQECNKEAYELQLKKACEKAGDITYYLISGKVDN